MERKHKRDGHKCTKGEKNTGAMGENGETIKIGTVVQHPFARPPHFFFYSVPNEDTRRASRDDAMVNKKEGEGGNKVPFGTFGNSRRFFFNRMLGSEKKVHTRDCRQFDCRGKLAK